MFKPSLHQTTSRQESYTLLYKMLGTGLAGDPFHIGRHDSGTLISISTGSQYLVDIVYQCN